MHFSVVIKKFPSSWSYDEAAKRIAVRSSPFFHGTVGVDWFRSSFGGSRTPFVFPVIPPIGISSIVRFPLSPNYDAHFSRQFLKSVGCFACRAGFSLKKELHSDSGLGALDFCLQLSFSPVASGKISATSSSKF